MPRVHPLPTFPMLLKVKIFFPFTCSGWVFLLSAFSIGVLFAGIKNAEACGTNYASRK